MTKEFKTDYDLTEIEVPVTIGGEKYVVREANGAGAVQYRNHQLKCTKLDPETGKPISVEGMASGVPLLVSLCLFKVKPDGSTESRPVSYATVIGWPHRIQKGIVEIAKSISEIEEEDETLDGLIKQRDELDAKIAKMRVEGEPAKNEQLPSPDGSD